jgi:CelD/BcsL family acetyltransferase involved in cellulose biosynthesis
VDLAGLIDSDSGRTVQTGADTAPAIGDITVFHDFADAEAIWRGFERTAVTTPYQRFDWLEAWHRHIGKRNGFKPLIVHVGTDDGETAFIWPLAVRSSGNVRVAHWLGCKLVNYRFGLYAPGLEAGTDRAALVLVLDFLRDEAGIDTLALTNQPEVWKGTRNPLLTLPHQESPSFAYSLPLQYDFDALYAERRSSSTRKKCRRNERRIEKEFGSCALRQPKSRDEVDRVLDAYFVQKSNRMRDKHVPNIFALPGVMDFFREIANQSISADEPLLDLFWLDAGGHVAATWAGTVAAGRMSGIITSYGEETFGRFRAGEILLRKVIEHCCRRGLTEFDLGVGEARYKSSWCSRTDFLFDSFVPLTAAGWMHSTVTKTGFRLKRAAKQSDFLNDLAGRLR